MGFIQFNIDDWLVFVIDQINTLLAKFNAEIDISYIDEPMTGKKMRFTSNDLYELYFILCKKTEKTILIANYDDFYTIRNIANTLHEAFAN